MSQHTPAATAPILVIDLQTGMLDGVAEPELRDALLDGWLAVAPRELAADHATKLGIDPPA